MGAAMIVDWFAYIGFPLTVLVMVGVKLYDKYEKKRGREGVLP